MIQIIMTTDQKDNNISKYNLYTEEAQKEFLAFMKSANEAADDGQRAAVNIAYKLERLVRQEDQSRAYKKQKQLEVEKENKPAFPEA